MDRQPNNNANMGPPAKVKITAKEFGAKYKVSALSLSYTHHTYMYLVQERGLQSSRRGRRRVFAELRSGDDILPERPIVRQEEK